ncbi:MAG: Uma2 family endonuclease [Firmicutes bacterium]|nr:Uma2 family endonuclease [Bacillota bacterium]
MMVPLTYNMSTTLRHIHLISGIESEFMINYKPEFKFGRYNIIREQLNLIYWNNDSISIMKPRLVDIHDKQNIPDLEKFRKNHMNDFDYIQPDLMLFFSHDNYVINDRQTRVAGFPDLIVEVWSDGNDREHRQFKRDLYATSPITEFWQVYQDKNIIKCSLNGKKLPNQNIKFPLKTKDGFTVDISNLALDE